MRYKSLFVDTSPNVVSLVAVMLTESMERNEIFSWLRGCGFVAGLNIWDGKKLRQPMTVDRLDR